MSTVTAMEYIIGLMILLFGLAFWCLMLSFQVTGLKDQMAFFIKQIPQGVLPGKSGVHAPGSPSGSAFVGHGHKTHKPTGHVV